MATNVMQARHKITEAQFFYGQMTEARDAPDHITFYLSAFLTAARSVRDYIGSETHANTALKAWWDQQTIHLEPIVAYFDTRRNYEVHLETKKGKASPDPVQQNVNVALTERVRVSESITIQVTRTDGTVEPPITYADPPSPPLPDLPATITRSYVFQDYPTGPIDVFTACHHYLLRLKRFVEEAERVV